MATTSVQCRYCGSTNYSERPHPMHGAGAWCTDCGRWIKWLGKTRTPEQEAKRQADKKMYIQEAMAAQDPTQKQMDYLEQLRYHGVPGSRLHASNIIDGMTRQGR